jgi:hypothetical protein
MHRQVHLAEVDSLQGFLLSIDGDCGADTEPSTDNSLP